MANDITLNQLARQLSTTKNRVKYYARALDASMCYKDSNGIVRVTPTGAAAIAQKIDARNGVTTDYNHFSTENRQKTTLAHNKAVNHTENRANNHFSTPENHTPNISTPEHGGAANSGTGATDKQDAYIIALLRAQLEAKDKQIQVLTDALQREQEATQEALTALKQEQALHAAAAIDAPQKKKSLLASLFHKKSADTE